jgi:hypothetical protein
MNYIKITFSLLVTTLYFMVNMQWNMDFCSLNKFLINKSHFNVVFFSIGYSNK